MRYPVHTVVTAVLAKLRAAPQPLEQARPAERPVIRISGLEKPIRLKNPPLRRAPHIADRASNM